MSVRIIIILLALPLFLLLAAVNSLLLYREETRDMEAGLRGQALAAAVTVAEFAKASPDPFAELSRPHRLSALHGTTGNITGLDALYLSEPGKPPLNLTDRPLTAPREGPAPAKAEVLGTRQDSLGRPLITAIVPAGKSVMVVADIDAEPLARRTFHLKRLSITLMAGAAALAILLGWIIARRVIGEFRRTRAIIEAHGESSDDQPLAIREVRDLADAIHLIDASVASELKRLEKDGKGDPAIGIAAARARHFPDISDSHAGIRLSIRTLANAPAGAFHLRSDREAGILLVLGEMEGETAQALAAAIALKDYVLAGQSEEFEKRIDAACRAFGARTIHTAFASADGEPLVMGLLGNPDAMRGYAARLPDLDPDDLTRDLSMLFPNVGIVAAAILRPGDAPSPPVRE